MKTENNTRNGSALLTVLGIVAVVSVVCGMLGVTANNQTRASQITREMLKARMIAESGLNKAYNAVKENFVLAKSYHLTEAYGGGTYTVRAVSLPNAGFNRSQLFSEGVYGLGKVVVAADLENYPQVLAGTGTGNNYLMPFDIQAGGTMDFKGDFHAEITQAHANGNATVSGSVSIDGAIVSSAGTVTWKNKPDGVTLRPNQPAQVIYPDDLAAAIDALKSYAIDNGAVYATGSDIPDSPPGGVAYCTGPDTGWSGNGTGCFIFGGTFATKHLDLTSVNNYPVLVVLSPNSLGLNAGTMLRGAVLLPTSSLNFNGNAEIDGPLLVGQNITGNGTADLYAGNGQQFMTPPKLNSADKVVITAWH
jgi:hypothetical protein